MSLEEKNITTVSIRPGVVDTDMQQEIREKHLSLLDEDLQKHFGSLKENGSLLKPEQPGNVIAKLSLEAPIQLSGKFFRYNNVLYDSFPQCTNVGSWNDEELASYRD